MPDPMLLDWAHLARQTFGERALEREVLALFDQQCVTLLPAVAGEGAGRSDALHTLKGASRAVGAWRVASLAERLERALQEGAAGEPLGRLVAELEVAIDGTRAALAARPADRI